MDSFGAHGIKVDVAGVCMSEVYTPGSSMVPRLVDSRERLA